MPRFNECQVKLGGMFGGIEACEEFHNEAKNLGFNLPKNICVQCAKKLISKAKSSPEFQSQLLERENIEKIFAIPSQLPTEMEDMGVVSGYNKLGTGPLSEFYLH